MKKVPGIDAAKIEAKKEILIFLAKTAQHSATPDDYFGGRKPYASGWIIQHYNATCQKRAFYDQMT